MTRDAAYADDAEIAAIVDGLLARTLPPSLWTHAAHCAATIHLLMRRPDLDLSVELPKVIRAYNAATGVANTDTSGFHETLTQFYLLAIAAFLARLPEGVGPAEATNRLVASRFGARDFPLAFYSRERLFSVEARRRWAAPDIAPLEFASIPIDGD